MKIVEFTNPSGKVAWRVSGRTTRGGGRVRKNFPSRAEAEAYLEDMLGDRRDGDYRHRMQRLTWLSPDQVRDAELAAELAPDVSFVEMAREYVARHETIRGVELGTALSEYKKDRLAAGVRQVTVDTTGYILGDWISKCRASLTSDVSARDVRSYVLDQSRSVRTRKDRRQVLGQFCRWCVGRGYMATVWTDRIPAVRMEYDLPRVLTVDECQSLLDAARDYNDLIYGYTLVCLFSGVRPTEARRLAESDLHLDPELSCIEISPRIAKVRQARSIDLAPGLRKRLSALPKPRIGYQRRWFEAIRKRAGLLNGWAKDVMRHTFATYHYAKIRDIGTLTYAMGNSEQVLFRNYIRPVPKAQAEAFWKLLG